MRLLPASETRKQDGSPRIHRQIQGRDAPAAGDVRPASAPPSSRRESPSAAVSFSPTPTPEDTDARLSGDIIGLFLRTPMSAIPEYRKRGPLKGPRNGGRGTSPTSRCASLSSPLPRTRNGPPRTESTPHGTETG